MIASILMIVLGLFFTGCGPQSSPAPSATPAAAPTDTPQPTPTTVPTPARKAVLLVTPPEADAVQVQNFQSVLTELAAGSGMDLRVVQGLQAAEITAEVQVVVAPTLLNNLPELLAAAPQVQFIMLSTGEVGASPNLTIIRSQPEIQAFAAGLLAEIISSDWRVAGLFSPDEPAGSLAQDAFREGGGYFCGVCNSVGAPVVRFPLTARLARTADQGVFQPVVDELQKNVVNVFYVDPSVSSPELLTYLAGQQYVLVGGQSPTTDAVRNRWAATVQMNPAENLKTLWANVLAGKGGTSVYSKVDLADVNSGLFSPGRQDLVKKMIADLEDGAIYPYSVPLQ